MKELLDGRGADSLIVKFTKTALPRKRFAIEELGHQHQPVIRPDLGYALSLIKTLQFNVVILLHLRLFYEFLESRVNCL